MIKDRSMQSKFMDIFTLVVCTLFLLAVLYPFVYMFSVSISDPVAVAKGQVNFIPVGNSFDSYKMVFNDNQLVVSYKNSIVYTCIGTTLTLLFNSLAAYALSRPNFYAKNFFVTVFTVTMFFSGGMIPAYLNIVNLGLLNTMWAVILPAVGMWNIVLIRTNFQQLPSGLVESAYIDGANDWVIWYKIVMPLSKAILATVAIFASVGYWNNYFGPLLYLNDNDKMTLPIILRRILISKESMMSAEQAEMVSIADGSNSLASQGLVEQLRMATIFVTIGPIVLVYPFAQRYFVKGVMIGSIKG